MASEQQTCLSFSALIESCYSRFSYSSANAIAVAVMFGVKQCGSTWYSKFIRETRLGVLHESAAMQIQGPHSGTAQRFSDRPDFRG